MKFLLVAILLHTGTSVFASICVAHRGDHTNTTENSLAALQSAYDYGAEAIEIDIRHTRDGVAIAMHDSQLKRTAQGQNCPLENRVNLIFMNTIQNRCRLKNKESIPTLQDIIDWHQGLKNPPILLIELKDSPRKNTARKIQRHFRSQPDKLRIISFNIEYLEEIKEHSSFFKNIASIYHISSKAKTVDRSYNGVAIKKPTQSELAKFDNDLEILVWTINDFNSIKRYKGYNVDYIATDRLNICL